MADNEEYDIGFIDLNSVPDGPPVSPAGEYHLKIVEAQTRKNKDPNEDGSDAFHLNYRVVIQSGPFQGRSFYSMWSLKPERQWQMKGDFKRLGYQPLGGRPSAKDLVGMEGIAKVAVRDKKDRDGEITGQENSVTKWLSSAA